MIKVLNVYLFVIYQPCEVVISIIIYAL